MISKQDQYRYPVGRRRLEPIGVLTFSVIMVTAFFQVALECSSRLRSGDHSIIELVCLPLLSWLALSSCCSIIFPLGMTCRDPSTCVECQERLQWGFTRTCGSSDDFVRCTESKGQLFSHLPTELG
jgi:hypothetical protein